MSLLRLQISTSTDLELKPQSAIRNPQSDTPPVRLPSLSSDELEHIEDQKLDDAYEEKLRITGDNLLPIVGASRRLLIRFWRRSNLPFQIFRDQTVQLPQLLPPAFDVTAPKNEIAPKREAVELPVLGDNPTEAELLEYANAHPTVQAAKRIFRAKIVEVKKI